MTLSMSQVGKLRLLGYIQPANTFYLARGVFLNLYSKLPAICDMFSIASHVCA